MEGVTLDREALTQSINFHGQQLYKICEGSSRLSDLLGKISPQNIHYKEYNARQKYLNFQDRGKRLRLQEFIVKNAAMLFDESFTAPTPESRAKVSVDETFFAAVPPFEAFCNADKETKIKRFFETTKVGDTLICVVSNRQAVIGVKILIVEGDKPHVVADLGIKAVLPLASINSNRPLLNGDSLRATVLEIVPEADKLVIGQATLYTDPMPSIYKKVTQDARNETYDNLLHKNVGFNNPGNMGYLGGLLGIGNENHSNLPGLRGRFPVEEYGSELRQLQAAKWAFKSVAEGIEHFKGGRHSEAFQCLNKALCVDPRNVEGLVARGALYANSGSFQKAIEDFEMALKVNPNHQNARKYMGETLVALGRSYEEKNQMEDAMRAYQHCLVLLPYHEEAQNSVEFLRSKNLIAPKEMEEHKEKKSKKEKKKKSKKKRHASTSGSSSSSSSSSSDSSSESSSSSASSSGSSQSSHSRSRRKKSKKNKKERKEKSLSPLSKRMQLMDSGTEVEGSQRNQCNPASLNRGPIDKETEYEMRVRAFLEQTKGDSDYEEKVRKFLTEATRLKLDRKSSDEKSKKKKKKEKKERKEKEKMKKRKREEKEEKKRRKRSKKDKSHEGDEEDEDELDAARLREALRKELNMKQELRRRVAAHDEEAAYEKRLSANHEDEVQVKLGGYYFKPKEGNKKYEEKRLDDRRRSIDKLRVSPKIYRTKSEEAEEKRENKKSIDIFEDSPPRAKPKIPVGPVGISSRYQSKKERDEKPNWDDVDDKQRIIYGKEETKKTNGDRKKSNAPPSPDDRIPLPADKPKSPPLPPPPSEAPIKTAVDKFSFRVKVIDTPVMKNKNEEVKRSASTGSSNSYERKKRSRREASSASSGSRKLSPASSRGRRSRSRSFNKYGSHSRSHSYRSSRSRSRSYDKYSRSRSRSPRRGSRSPRRHVNRFPRHQRGTYYKPRFQNNPHQYRNQRGRDNYNRGRGYYGNRYDNRYDRGRGRGGFTPRGNARGRGRYFHNNRPQHYNDNRRRYYDDDRRRSRDRSRSLSYDDRDEDPMRKVGAAKDKIDKYIEMEEKAEPRKRDEPLSEGEAPDSPPRKPEGPNLPPDGDGDDLDKYLSKGKSGKKDDLKERSKD